MSEETKDADIELTDEEFESKVLKSKLPVVVDCYAVWCGPCRMLTPIIEELAEEYKGKITVYKLDVDKNPKSSEKYELMSIPTILYFAEGKMVNKTMGAMPKQMLEDHFKALIK
jgi:thioredoxin 1